MLKQLFKSLVGKQSSPRIAFDRRNLEESHPGEGIYTVNSDGSDCKQIFASGYSSYPTWSPNGKWIAFADGDDSNVFVMDENGKQIRQLTFHQGEGISVSYLTWSPDSRQLAYCLHEYVHENHEEQIYVVDLGSGGAKQLTYNGTNTECVWLPSNEIVFHRNVDQGWGKPFIMNPDGQNQREYNLLGLRETYPSWSVDGKKMIYCKVADNLIDRQYFVMNTDGSEKTLIPVKTRVCNMVISPDGKSVAYSGGDGDTFEVFVLPLDGNPGKKIVANTEDFNTSELSWSPIV